MHLKHAYLAAVMALALLMGGPVLRAQGNVNVKLKVYDYWQKNLFDAVWIYVFETEEEGLAAATKFSKAKAGANFSPDDPSRSKNLEGSGGIVELNDVSTEGSIFFAVLGDNDAAHLEPIKGRSEIAVYLKAGKELPPSIIHIDLPEDEPGPKPPRKHGDYLYLSDLSYTFPKLGATSYDSIPKRIGRTDSRFVIQTYLVPADTTQGRARDTLEWRKVVVMDGRDYHQTQLRRMGFNPKNDPLYSIAHNTPVLTDSTESTPIPDTLFISPEIKERGGVLLKAKVWFEDYNRVYYQKQFELADSRRVFEPMRFLEYSSEPARLNPNDPLYLREPINARRPGEIRLPIQFAVGQARVDASDAASLQMLDSLRRTVYRITHNQNAIMRQIAVMGFSSPEGNYASNDALARERVNYIISEVKTQIPADKLRSLRTPVIESRVATWDDLADTLAKDGYLEEARKMHAITSAAQGNIDAQTPQIKRLPFYETLIKNNLHRLRMVHFQWIHEETRPMTDDEILDKFYHDPNFRPGGPSEFTEYEFWVLMQKLEGKELEQICKRAIKKDLERAWDHRWTLPANVLATSYLKQGIVDTTILAPYIHTRLGKCNVNRSFNEYKFCLNPAPVVANQVSMMLRGEYYDRAVQLAELLNDPQLFQQYPEYHLLYAVVRCRAGYWESADYETDPAEWEKAQREKKEYEAMISGSTPRNTVVMDIANNRFANARFRLNNMDQNDPVTLYLKAQLECLEFYTITKSINFASWDYETQDNTIHALETSFRLDPSLIEAAKNDWFIFKELYEKALEASQNPDKESGFLTEEQKQALINKAIFHPGEMTQEEWDLYYNNKLDKFEQ